MKHKIKFETIPHRAWEVFMDKVDEKQLELYKKGEIYGDNICRDSTVYISGIEPIVELDGKEIEVEITDDMYKVETISLAEWCKRESQFLRGNVYVRFEDADAYLPDMEWFEDMMPDNTDDVPDEQGIDNENEQNIIETDEEFDKSKLKILITNIVVGDDSFEIAEGIEYDGKFVVGCGGTNDGTNGCWLECIVNTETGEIVERRE